MNSGLRKIIDKVRDLTPLWLRIRIGPLVGYASYFARVRLGTNRSAPKVLPLAETLDRISEENLSVIRFGDGELSAIADIDLGFQKRNAELAIRLKEVLCSNVPGLMICIPGIFGRLEHFKSRAFWFTIHHLFRHGHVWGGLLSKSQTYGDAFITRPYLTYKDTSGSAEMFRKLFTLWEGKDVVLVEGGLSRLGVGNDMFKNANSVQRILCPSEHAFDKYQDIKRETLKVGKEKLVLLSLGPTAKILGYELFALGYRILDIGHIDMEYEMFLRESSEIKKVRYKYFNEIGERSPEDCADPEYLSQIIATIT